MEGEKANQIWKGRGRQGARVIERERGEGRKGIEGGVSNVREGAAFVNVCGHVSVCGCVRGERRQAWRSSISFQQAVSQKKCP